MSEEVDWQNQVVGIMLTINVEGSVNMVPRAGEIVGHVGVIKVHFTDWPMDRELWRSELFGSEEDANRAAHDQLCDCLRALFDSRVNGAAR